VNAREQLLAVAEELQRLKGEGVVSIAVEESTLAALRALSSDAPKVEPNLEPPKPAPAVTFVAPAREVIPPKPAADAARIKGKKSADIAETIGYDAGAVIVHADDLVLS
jgi:hypothetical protein